MQTKTLVGTLAAVALTFGTAGAFVIAADQAQSSPAPNAQQRACVARIVALDRAAKPEYPEDIAYDSWHACKVHVDVDVADGQVSIGFQGGAR